MLLTRRELNKYKKVAEKHQSFLTAEHHKMIEREKTLSIAQMPTLKYNDTIDISVMV